MSRLNHKVQNMSKLILVPTPIGNLEDITLRAINVLQSADIILAEDTRTSGILLKHLGISKPMMSYHKFNEHKSAAYISGLLQAGSTAALISDAGTPGISDPGFFLVRHCLQEGIEVETLPGPTAFIPALINSGFPCDKFCFEGFLPQKKGRHKLAESLKNEKRTMIFYESPHRLLKTLDLFIEYFGENHLVSVSRELTKIHEETIRGSLKEVKEYYSTHVLKGEIVIVLKGAETIQTREDD